MSEVAVSALTRWREHPASMVEQLFGVIPDLWQRDVLEAFPHNPRMAMKASKGVGKALRKSSMLPTPCGDRRWGDLKPGDFVFAEDGSPTRIRNVYDQGLRPFYRVHFDDGSYTDCCGEHLWKIRGQAERSRKHAVPYQRGTQNNEIWSVLSTEQIIARGVRVKNGRWSGRQFEIPRQGAAQFPQALLPVDPYFLGIWLGDGTANKSQYTKDTPEIDTKLIERGFSVTRNGLNVWVHDAGTGLRQAGVYTLNSPDRYIPKDYKIASIEQRRDLLGGLLDTDGTVGKQGHVEYTTTSKQLALDVVWIARSLGGIAFIKDAVKKAFYYDEQRNKVPCKDCYRVSVRLAFNPFTVVHKAKRWTPAVTPSQLRYLTRYIDRIEPIGEDGMQCIEIEHPSACYLTNDFIVTHNTSTLAWCAWNFLLTRPNPKIAATSITGDNLADNLWAEMALWQQKSELLMKGFTWTKTRIFANDKPETWFMSARSWSKSANSTDIGNALAGLHADYIMFVLDESGGMPEAIMASAEAALSSCVEGHILQAGNPTHLEGPLYRACTEERSLWHVTEISSDPDNPKRSQRVSVQWAKEQIQKYGRDNPYVMVNVLGQFPQASLNALIGPEEVREAMKRTYNSMQYGAQPRIMGVDVARYGADKSVITHRQGLQVFSPREYRNISGTQGADILARRWTEWEADACFIDDTGGFGASWIDNLIRLGFAPIGIHFAQRAASPRFNNKRTEMAFEAIEWVKRGGALPEIPDLVQEMSQTTYSHKGDTLVLEPKEAVKAKLGRSPDYFDSLMLTFAQPVSKATSMRDPWGERAPSRHTYDYNPLSRAAARKG